jgi:hypothetical protein
MSTSFDGKRIESDGGKLRQSVIPYRCCQGWVGTCTYIGQHDEGIIDTNLFPYNQPSVQPQSNEVSCET